MAAVSDRPSALNRARRERELNDLARGKPVDVLIIGGGVTGAGVALDAVTRGLSVALVERGDLANGTSRWSSKLIHGGLRYLAHAELDLAWESAVERGILLERTAPHLVRRLAMVFPVAPGALRGANAVLTGVGLLAGNGLRVAAGTARSTLPPPRWIGPVRVRRLVPAVRRHHLAGAFVTFEGQLVDDARLVLGLARTAAAFGARILTYCAAERIDGDGALVRDVLPGPDGPTLRIAARHVVNAAGVWAGDLVPEVELAPSRGAHLVLDGAALGSPIGALTVPVPGTINRFVFALPQPDGRIYLGLTDDPAAHPVPDEPTARAEEQAFLLDTVNTALEHPLDASAVRGSFAGYRPLLAGREGPSADLSRRHAVIISAAGVLTAVGGKLTTYRRMAQDIVDRIVARPGVVAGPCRTRRHPLVGALGRAGLPALAVAPSLRARYGAEAADVAALATGAGASAIVDGLPYLRAELAWAVAVEGALTESDLLDRRTRIGLVAADRAAAMPAAQEALAEPPTMLAAARP